MKLPVFKQDRDWNYKQENVAFLLGMNLTSY